MTDERFRLEADLRATIRADRWGAFAWDTGNTWRFSTATGEWFCLNQPAEARLVPTVGASDLGKLLRVDPVSATPVLVSPIDNVPPTNASASNTAAQVEVVTTTIPGGALGPDGYMRCRVFGQFTNTTGGSRTLQVGDFNNVPWTHSATSQSYPTGNAGSLVYTCEIWNEGSESTQRILDRIDLAKSSIPHDALPAQGPMGGGGTDTSVDWSYSVGFTMSAASASLSWLVFKILIETFYG